MPVDRHIGFCPVISAASFCWQALAGAHAGAARALAEQARMDRLAVVDRPPQRAVRSGWQAPSPTWLQPVFDIIYIMRR